MKVSGVLQFFLLLPLIKVGVAGPPHKPNNSSSYPMRPAYHRPPHMPYPHHRNNTRGNSSFSSTELSPASTPAYTTALPVASYPSAAGVSQTASAKNSFPTSTPSSGALPGPMAPSSSTNLTTKYSLAPIIPPISAARPTSTRVLTISLPNHGINDTSVLPTGTGASVIQNTTGHPSIHFSLATNTTFPIPIVTPTATISGNTIGFNPSGGFTALPSTTFVTATRTVLPPIPTVAPTEAPPSAPPKSDPNWWEDFQKWLKEIMQWLETQTAG